MSKKIRSMVVSGFACFALFFSSYAKSEDLDVSLPHATFVVVLKDKITGLEWSETLPGLYSNGCSYTTNCFLLGEDGSPINNYDDINKRFLETPEEIAALNGGVKPVIDYSNVPFGLYYRIHPDYSEAAQACKALGTVDRPARLPTPEEYNTRLKYSAHNAYPFLRDMNGSSYWVDGVLEKHLYVDFETGTIDQRGVGLIWFAFGDLVNYSDLQESKHQVRCVRDILN